MNVLLPPRANPPVRAPHETVPVQCWIEIDLAIAPLVEYLNTIPGVRTEASCEGGICYGPQVMVSWLKREAFDFLSAHYYLGNIETGEPVTFESGIAYIMRPDDREWTKAAKDEG